MDEFEADLEAGFETDGHPDAEAAARAPSVDFAGEAEPAAQAPSVDFAAEAEPVDFTVDYEHSGDRRVDDALDRLAGLPGIPLPGHADVYDTIHTELRAILSEQPAGAQGPR